MAALSIRELGALAATAGAAEMLGENGVVDALNRHLDWSELTEHDGEQNEAALEEGGRILSAYATPHGDVWVITEADRSATTVLLPEEY